LPNKSRELPHRSVGRVAVIKSVAAGAFAPAVLIFEELCFDSINGKPRILPNKSREFPHRSVGRVTVIKSVAAGAFAPAVPIFEELCFDSINGNHGYCQINRVSYLTALSVV